MRYQITTIPKFDKQAKALAKNIRIVRIIGFGVSSANASAPRCVRGISRFGLR